MDVDTSVVFCGLLRGDMSSTRELEEESADVRPSLTMLTPAAPPGHALNPPEPTDSASRQTPESQQDFASAGPSTVDAAPPEAAVSHEQDSARRRLSYRSTEPTNSIGAERSSSARYNEITSAVEMVSLDGNPNLGSPLSPEIKERMAASRADALARRVAALERRLAAIEERANAPCLHCSGPHGAPNVHGSPGRSVKRAGSPARTGEGKRVARETGALDQRQPNIDPVTTAPKVADLESPPQVVLSAKQREVLAHLQEGKSAFVTGSAGTGKSTMLLAAIKMLKAMHGEAAVFVTASTGIAAVQINGTTLHSFAGVLIDPDPERMLGQAIGRAHKRWTGAKALIVDEISMVDAQFLDTLEYIARTIRKNEEPFGGIQLLFSGDFFQLPPVDPKREKKFAFEAVCWQSCMQLQIELQEVFRQEDRAFVKILNEVRWGEVSPEAQAALLQCDRAEQAAASDGVEPTKLYPRKVDVRLVNETALRRLNRPITRYIAQDSGQRGELLAQIIAEEQLDVCVGAQVMLIKNLNSLYGLCNGSRGVVRGFTQEDDWEFEGDRRDFRDVCPSGTFPIVYFPDAGALPPDGGRRPGMELSIRPEAWTMVEGEQVIARRVQVPLLPSWALSVHKCQGMTLDRVETDLSKAFERGMCYVALSRVRSPGGLKLKGFHPSKVKVDPKVKAFYATLGSRPLKTEVKSEGVSDGAVV